MKTWSVVGLLCAATIVELSVDQAQAVTYRRARVTARRVGRREYRQERRAHRRGY